MNAPTTRFVPFTRNTPGPPPAMFYRALMLALAILGVSHSGTSPVQGVAHAASMGPQAGLTGVPAIGEAAAEMTCTSCHNAYIVNPDDDGVIALEGLPEIYEPGRTYELEFRVRHPREESIRWGFQLSPILRSTGSGAGRLIVTDAATTQIVRGLNERSYIEHAYGGTHIGKTQGAEWSFSWKAPDDGGEVAFYAAANAANADGAHGGDRIYSRSPEPLAVLNGAGKAIEDGAAENAAEPASQPEATTNSAITGEDGASEDTAPDDTIPDDTAPEVGSDDAAEGGNPGFAAGDTPPPDSRAARRERIQRRRQTRRENRLR